MPKTRRTFTPEAKARLVALLTRSGKPLAHFAKDNQIAESVLRKWRDQFSEGNLSGSTSTKENHMSDRPHYTAAFKAKLVHESMKGLRPIGEIAQEYGVPPASLSAWRTASTKNKSHPPAAVHQILGTVNPKVLEKELHHDRAQIQSLHEVIGRQHMEIAMLRRQLPHGSNGA